MSYSKISSIILWAVAGISLLVMIFFFVAENTTMAEEVDKKVEQLLAEGYIPEAEEAPAVIEADSTVADTLNTTSEESAEEANSNEAVSNDESAEPDSATLAAAPVVDTPVEGAIAPEEIDLRDYFTGMELLVHKRTDYALVWAYILFIVAAIAAIVFPFINIFSDVKALLRMLAILGGAAVLIIIAYLLASDQTIEIVGYTGTENSNPSILRWVGTGLIATYFMFGFAVISILYSEVVKLFK